MPETVIANSPIDKALALQARGFHVFPCKSDKTPACAHGHLAATDDPVVLRVLFARPDAVLVGISCPASHIHVLDIDPLGEPYYQQHKGELPATVEIRTRRGGRHLIFRADDPSVVVRQGARNGIDTRSANPGHGGYIIAWGEAHEYDRNRMSAAWPAAFVAGAWASPRFTGNGGTVWLQPPATPIPAAFSQTIADEIRMASWAGGVPPGEQDNFLVRAYGHALKAVQQGWAAPLDAIEWCGRVNTRWILPDHDKDFTGKLRRVGFDPAVVAVAGQYENVDNGQPIEPFLNGAAFPVVEEPVSDPFAGLAPGGQPFDPPPLDQHPLATFVPFTRTLRVPEYVIPGFIGVGLITIAGAHGKGKTTALVPLALIAAGVLANPELSPGPDRWRHIVYITEDVSQVQGILHCHVKQDGVDPDLLEQRFHLVEAKRMDVRQFVQIGKLYQDKLARTVNGVTLKPVVVVDTRSASFQVEDENANAEASKIAAALKQDFQRLPTMLVGHIAKADMTKADALTMRGAGAIEGDAQQCLYIVEEEGDRYLVRGKTRFEARWDALLIESQRVVEQAVDIFGDSVSLALRWARISPAAGKPGTKGVVTPGHHKAALRVLEELITAGRPPLFAHNGAAAGNKFSAILMGRLGWDEKVALRVVTDIKMRGYVTKRKLPKAVGAKHPETVMDLTQVGRDLLLDGGDFAQNNPF